MVVLHCIAIQSWMRGTMEKHGELCCGTFNLGSLTSQGGCSDPCSSKFFLIISSKLPWNGLGMRTRNSWSLIWNWVRSDFYIYVSITCINIRFLQHWSTCISTPFHSLRQKPHFTVRNPPGKRLHSHGKSQFLLGKATNQMAIFSSKLLVYQRVPNGHTL